MNVADLIKIILAPCVTEKAMAGGASEQPVYAFKVHKEANKKQIGAAIEAAFGVKVDCVRTANFQGKMKRFGRMLGRQNHWKKAYVKLEKGQVIDLVAREG